MFGSKRRIPFFRIPYVGLGSAVAGAGADAGARGLRLIGLLATLACALLLARRLLPGSASTESQIHS